MLNLEKSYKINVFQGLVQGSRLFHIKGYKSKKSLKFNDSLKIIYNRKNTSNLEP